MARRNSDATAEVPTDAGSTGRRRPQRVDPFALEFELVDAVPDRTRTEHGARESEIEKFAKRVIENVPVGATIKVADLPSPYSWLNRINELPYSLIPVVRQDVLYITHATEDEVDAFRAERAERNAKRNATMAARKAGEASEAVEV